VAGLAFDAQAIAPFTTGLGNEHPLENGFAFLNPYGLPYLPGSGVKGVLRQAARELAKGEWGQSEWSAEKRYSLPSEKDESIPLSMLDVLFGRETADGDTEHLRGALTFWDVIPQIKGDHLHVEIITPHQKHYYQDGQNPHDSGQPVPISFLTVPPGSGFTFFVQCNLALLERHAPELANGEKWKHLLLAAFEHAFNWLGFGAKTAVGYGAMQENAAKKAEREEQLRKQQEEARRSTLSPDDLAWEVNQPVITKFREAFEQASKTAYQAGQDFDNKRNDFIKAAEAWTDQRSRTAAAELLSETLKWGVSKKGKDSPAGLINADAADTAIPHRRASPPDRTQCDPASAPAWYFPAPAGTAGNATARAG
jgi:CRISPR-associated protein Cmr6